MLTLDLQVYQNPYLPRGATEVNAIVSVSAGAGQGHMTDEMMEVFLLDCSASMGFGSPVTKLRYGAAIAAALSYLMVMQQDAAGVTLFAVAAALLLYEAVVRPTFLVRLFGPAAASRPEKAASDSGSEPSFASGLGSASLVRRPPDEVDLRTEANSS